ncbi:MAG: hypothetical protein WCA84_14320 [Ignavibacteriaceae bacterium]
MKHIILKVNQEKFKTLKTLIKELKDSSPKAVISPITQGNLGDDIMASFTVDDDHYQRVIENLNKKDFKLFGNDAANEKKKIAPESPVNYSTGRNTPFESQTVSKNDSPVSILDSAIKNGDFEKVIQLSKDYRNFEVQKKAKDNIDVSINNAIDHAYNRAIKNKYEVDKSLTILIKIASDNNLKNLHKTGQIKSAGLKAVELCSIYKDNLNILIQICNNNAIPHIVCIKAAIRLAIIISQANEKAEEEMDYAVRYLNLRWLDIAFYSVNLDLSENERKIYEVLISSIKERISAGGY